MTHVDPETLAAFAEGKLRRKEIALVLAHLRNCRECMQDVEALTDAEQRGPRGAWLAAAAAVVAIVIGAAYFVGRGGSGRDPVQRLVELAPRSARIIEPRLTGGFRWAPYRGPMRADETSADADRLKLAGAAGEAVARAKGNADADAERVAGIALLLAEKPVDALPRLRAAADKAPNDPRIWSDYAAALHENAVRSARASLLPEALAAADRALRIDPTLAEALFNRALILESLGLPDEARKAWNAYLDVDGSSRWAAEAREHLRRLPATTGERRFRDEQPRLERAALANETRLVDELVKRHPQQSRAFGEAEYLGRWGETGADEPLTIARAIGAALWRHSGETLLRDAVQAIDSADAARRVQLAAAQAVYRRGRIAYGRQQPTVAEPELRKAAALFRQAGSPMALVARYFAACTRYDGGDIAGAREELTALIAEIDRPYLAAAAQVRWQLALTFMADADWSAALQTLGESEALFRALGEQSNLGHIRGMQATSLSCLGQPDDAWSARIQSFRLLSAEGRADRLPVSVGGASRAELYAGRLETARALSRIEVATNRDNGGMLLANALVYQTLLDAQLGDDEAAAGSARELFAVAAAIPDRPLRETILANANLSAGAAALRTDPRRARELLTSAIDFYRLAERPLFLPRANLIRARAALMLGDRSAAARDLDDGLAATERHRVRLAGSVIGTDVLDAGVELGREAIRLRLDAGDVDGAFDYAERRNRQVAADGESAVVTLAELQRRLRGSGTAVLLVALLPSEAATICVTEHHVATARVPVDERTLIDRAARAIATHEDAGALYDAFVRPVATSLARASRVVIVPDPMLRQVPFAALYDTTARRYLAESLPVMVADRASSLHRRTAAVQPASLLAVGLPSGSMATLPDARQELADVSALYPTRVTLEPDVATFDAFADAAKHANVVHIAGHTSRERGTDDLALPFGTRRVSWRDLASLTLPSTAVVIVAGCETLRGPDVRNTRGLSLAGGFLAAGAADAIGTLTPVADRDARDFFRAVHRHLAAGVPAGDALQRAQLEAIAAERAGGQRTPWRAIAIVTHSL